jgi:Spy/CpxP family protein refolding chaperone
MLMKRSTSILLAGLMATTLGAAVPAVAQDAPAEPRPGDQRLELMLRHHGGGLMRHHRGAGRGHGGALMLACSERGADRLEHMLLSLSQRLDPAPEQQPLFEAFSAAARAAQSSFADSCARLRPQGGSAAPDLVERLETGIAIGEARLAAMHEVLPALEAFYGSLTDEQKAQLEPAGRGRHGMHRRPAVMFGAPAAPAPRS